MFLGFENVMLNRLAFIKFVKDKENLWCLFKTNMDVTQKEKKIQNNQCNGCICDRNKVKFY